MSSKTARERHERDRPVLSFGRFETALLVLQNIAIFSAVFLARGAEPWTTSSVTSVAVILLLIGGAGVLWNAFSRANLLRRREDAYRSALLAADRFEQAAENAPRDSGNW